MYLVNDPHKAMSLGVCEEFFIQCNLHRDQALNLWVIITRNMKLSFLFIVYVMHVVYHFDSFNLLCDRRHIF